MASTYSTNLGIELIGTGDQAGAWGNTTNTNLGTLIEQSISGYVTQAVSDDPASPTTLTIPNGASGVARNMYIELTGALTAARNVIVPANKKIYFIYNNTTGGYAVTVKVAGQTGVSVPNGNKTILVSNGTDIVTAANSGVSSVNVSGGTTGLTTSGGPVTGSGTITLSGTLTPSNGGTGQSSYTDGQLLIGNSSGNTLTKSTLTAGTGISVTNGNGSITISSSGPTGFTTGTLTALGISALGSNVGSTVSTAVGYEALKAQTTANWNTAVGYQAGKAVTTGGANTFIGYIAGFSTTTAAASVALGDSALSSGNYGYAMGLGQGAQVTGGNQNQIGNSGTTTYAYGAVQDRSDARDKTDIQDTDLGLNFVMALRPRKYKWDMRDDYRPKPPAADAPESEWEAYRKAADLSNITHDGSKKRNRYHQGLIAQEVKATMDAMGVDFGGYQDHSVKGGQDVMSIGYNEMIAPLIKAIQELKTEFDEYKRTHP